MTVEFKQDEIVRLLRFFCIPSSQCLVVGMSKRFGAEERDEQFPPAGQAGHSFQKRVEWFFLSVSFPSCCRRRQERHGPLRLTYVAEGFRDGWRSFPIGCIRYTRTEPPLSFCENVDYARGAFRSRRAVFDAACAEVRDLMSRICDAAAASNAAAAGSEKNLIKKLTHLKKTRTSFVLFFGLERTSRREPPATPVLVRRPAQFRRRPRRAARTADATDAGYVIRGADGAGATSGCYRIFFFHLFTRRLILSCWSELEQQLQQQQQRQQQQQPAKVDSRFERYSPHWETDSEEGEEEPAPPPALPPPQVRRSRRYAPQKKQKKNALGNERVWHSLVHHLIHLSLRSCTPLASPTSKPTR